MSLVLHVVSTIGHRQIISRTTTGCLGVLLYTPYFSLYTKVLPRLIHIRPGNQATGQPNKEATYIGQRTRCCYLYYPILGLFPISLITWSPLGTTCVGADKQGKAA